MYSIYRINKDLNIEFVDLNNKEKVLNLLDDQVEMKMMANRLRHKIEMNYSKIESFLEGKNEA